MKENSKLHPLIIFPLLYVVSVYLFPVFFVMMEESSLASYLVYLPLVLGVINIIVSVIFCKPENRIILFHSTVLVKYALIPFFIIGGMILTASFLMSFIPVPFMIFVGPVVTVLGSVIGWLVLAFGAPYAIAYLRLAAKAGVRSKAAVVLHIILQFFFTLDVIDVMILTLKERRWQKLTLFLVILLGTAIRLCWFLIIFGIIGILS